MKTKRLLTFSLVFTLMVFFNNCSPIHEGSGFDLLSSSTGTYRLIESAPLFIDTALPDLRPGKRVKISLKSSELVSEVSNVVWTNSGYAGWVKIQETNDYLIFDCENAGIIELSVTVSYVDTALSDENFIVDLSVGEALDSVLDGKKLYATNCQSCHGSLESSDKRGVSLSSTKSAINSNKGNMGSLKTLSDEELQAIIDVLK